jgi:hypothetical protein
MEEQADRVALAARHPDDVWADKERLVCGRRSVRETVRAAGLGVSGIWA